MCIRPAIAVAQSARALEHASDRADKGEVALEAPLYRRALVVFAGRAGVWWLRWLRPGFRHCFAAVDDGAQWLTIDPLLHRLEIRASGLPSAFDLAAEYRRMDLIVLDIGPLPVALRSAPFGIFSCVETVKRVLGLRARWVFTPWQLYRFLERHDDGRAGEGADTILGDAQKKNKTRK
jgi:hypothetical protein